MTTLAHKRLSIAGGAALLVALLLVVLSTAYRRSSWPFAPALHEVAPQRVRVIEATGEERHRETSSRGGEADDHESHARSGGHPTPKGYAPVRLDPARAEALRLTTAAVAERDFERVVRTVGVVTFDETRTAHVHSKVRGWIEKVHVDFVGKTVRAGEVLCWLYSQEVYSAELELLAVLERASGLPGAGGLLEAARQRLAFWDVPQSEIQRLEATREPRRTFPLLAPRAGTVVAKEAIQGMYVEPSLELYTLSDLSRVWVLVDVYESDVPYVRIGDRARLTVEGGLAPLEGVVSFLSPTLDEATRTRKVRFELENAAGRLLPGAFAGAELDLAMGRGLAIPESAVIRTGTRAIVFVAHGEQSEHIEPREVTLGPLMGGSYRVEAGLAVGERVATGAQFLLDSESRLRATSVQGGAHAH